MAGSTSKVLAAGFYAFVLPLMATGCSYSYDIVAVEKAGSILFEAGTTAKGSGCFADFSVADEHGTVVWELHAPGYIAPPCQSDFPLIYGAVPAGMTERIKAVPLRPGVVYEVSGWDGDHWSGRFRFRHGIVVENIPEAQ